MPCSHASVDPATRATCNLHKDCIWLCIGIEDTEDLINDLEQATKLTMLGSWAGASGIPLYEG
jgi:cystathionine beta-lyase/cystathionine gamma-synthase